MKQMFKGTLCVFISIVISFSLVGCNTGNKSSKSEEDSIKTIGEFEIVDPLIREYLNAEGDEKQIIALNNLRNRDLDRQKLIYTVENKDEEYKLSWDDTGFGEYYVFISENQNFSKSLIIKTSINEIDSFKICIPGKTYYYKVCYKVDEKYKTINTGEFYCKNDVSVRFIDVDGISNFRDIGGWVNEDGNKINYGLIYRCGQTTTIRTAGIKVTEYLGIKTEIDLRDKNDKLKNDQQKTCSFGFEEDGYSYVEAPVYSYLYNFGISSSNYAMYSTSLVQEVSQSLKTIFSILSKEENYPLVYHCNAGADRTGFITYLINGLLGVSYDDLTRDFELTTVAGTFYSRYRSNFKDTDGKLLTKWDTTITANDYSSGSCVCWPEVTKIIMERYGTDGNKLSDAIHNYLLSQGVTEKELKAVKDIMIEK